MPQRILNEDWSDYDNKKIRDQRDGRFFSCTEPWEVDYLVRKIKKHLPNTSESTIRLAILACCQIVKGNQLRADFVRCAMNRLQ